MTVDRWNKPALLIVDLQNDFVRQGAAMEVPDARLTIPHNKRLIAFFRQAGFPIIYTRFISGPYRTLVYEWSPQLEPPLLACQRGHFRYFPDVDKTLDCTDVIDELYPQPGDYIVDKYGYGAFHRTNLDDILQSLGVESLVVTGTRHPDLRRRDLARRFSPRLQDHHRLGRRFFLPARPACRHAEKPVLQIRLGEHGTGSPGRAVGALWNSSPSESKPHRFFLKTL